MGRTITMALAAAFLLVGIAGCGEGATPPQPPMGNHELEAALIELLGITEDQANGSSVVPLSARTGVSLVSASDHGTCTFSSESGRFVCPDVTRDSMTISRSYALFDAGGRTQSRRDSTTVAINTRVWARGTAVMKDARATIDRRSDLTANGVQPTSATRRLDGTEHGTLKVETTTSRGRILSALAFGDTTIGLVLPQRDPLQKWPLAGTVIRAHSGTRSLEGSSESRSFSQRAVFVYDGSSTVKITITVNGQTRTCTRNLATREHSCAP